jgi:hypothetical protein
MSKRTGSRRGHEPGRCHRHVRDVLEIEAEGAGVQKDHRDDQDNRGWREAGGSIPAVAQLPPHQQDDQQDSRHFECPLTPSALR